MFFWFASRNLLFLFYSLITRFSSSSFKCWQCFFWSYLKGYVLITAALLCSPSPSVLLHGCLQRVWIRLTSGELHSQSVWPAGIGHLQGTVRINEGQKVLLIQYSSLSESIEVFAELPDKMVSRNVSTMCLLQKKSSDVEHWIFSS